MATDDTRPLDISQVIELAGPEWRAIAKLLEWLNGQADSFFRGQGWSSKWKRPPNPDWRKAYGRLEDVFFQRVKLKNAGLTEYRERWAVIPPGACTGSRSDQDYIILVQVVPDIGMPRSESLSVTKFEWKYHFAFIAPKVLLSTTKDGGHEDGSEAPEAETTADIEVPERAELRLNNFGLRLEASHGGERSIHGYPHCQYTGGFEDVRDLGPFYALDDRSPTIPVPAQCPMSLLLAGLKAIYGTQLEKIVEDAGRSDPHSAAIFGRALGVIDGPQKADLAWIQKTKAAWTKDLAKAAKSRR
jgi:hypothetical protein